MRRWLFTPRGAFVYFGITWLLASSAWAFAPWLSGNGLPAPTLTGVTLSNSSFTCGSAGAVGAVTVQGTGSIGATTLSLTGTDAAQFSLSSTTVPSNLTVGASPAGCPRSYSINIVATLGGATGSPFTAPETIVGSSGGAPTIPAGVAFVPIDGESITSQSTGTMTHSYWSTWSHASASYGSYSSGMNSTNFIPLGPFDTNIANSADVALFKQVGWNMNWNDGGGSDLTLFNANGFYDNQNADHTGPIAGTTGAETPGWFTVDDNATLYSDMTSGIQASGSGATGRFQQANGPFGWMRTGSGGSLSGSPTVSVNSQRSLYGMLTGPVSITGDGTGTINLYSLDAYAFSGCNQGETSQLQPFGNMYSMVSANATALTNAQCVTGSVYGDEISLDRYNLNKFQADVSGTPTWSAGTATIALAQTVPTANLTVGSNILLSGFSGVGTCGWLGVWRVTSVTGSPITSLQVAMPNNPGSWTSTGCGAFGGTLGYSYGPGFSSPIPLLGGIETGGPYSFNTSTPTYIQPDQLNWAVWSSFIHGAQGIYYFNFPDLKSLADPPFTTPWSPNSISMTNQVQATDYLVTSLAPAIKSPVATGYVTVSPAGYLADNDLIQTPANFGGIEVRATYNSTVGPTNGFTIFADTRDTWTTTGISATFTLNDTVAVSVNAIDGLAPTNGTCSTSSPTVTMLTFNPGWVASGQTVLDITTGNTIGTVSSWSTSSNTLTLTGNAAHTCASGDNFEFTRSLSVSGSGPQTFTDTFAKGSSVHIYQVVR